MTAKVKPEVAFTVNPDGSIRLVTREAKIDLVVPTIGELKKLEAARQQMLVDLEPVTERLQTINDEQVAAAAGDAVVVSDPAITAEVRDLVQQQRERFGTFWADVVIPLLANQPGTMYVADDLPASLGHGVTVGRAFRAWESSPPDPGVG